MPKPNEPQIDLTAKNDDNGGVKFPISLGMLVGLIVAVIALYFGISSLSSSNSADQYKGFIGEIEKSTQELNSTDQETIIPQAPERLSR